MSGYHFRVGLQPLSSACICTGIFTIEYQRGGLSESLEPLPQTGEICALMSATNNWGMMSEGKMVLDQSIE